MKWGTTLAYSLTLAAATSGCSTPRGAAGGAPTPKRAPVESAQGARRQLQAAAAASDAAAMRLLFGDSATLRVLAGDTVRGAAPVADSLARLGGGALTFSPELVDRCDAGTREVGMLQTADQHLYAYRLEWVQEDDSVRVGSLEVLQAQPRLDALRRRCAPTRQENRFDGRDWALTVFASPIVAASDGGGDGLNDAMHDLRWDRDFRYCLTLPLGQSCYEEQFPGRTGGSSALLLGVANRHFRPFVLELVAARLPSGTVSGYNSSTYSIYGAHDAAAVSLLGSVEWRRLRIGLGPALQRLGWSWGEKTLPSALNPARYTSGVESWSATKVGAALQASAALPVTSRIFFEFRYNAGLFGEQEVRGYRDFPATRVSASYHLFGFGVGVRP